MGISANKRIDGQQLGEWMANKLKGQVSSRTKWVEEGRSSSLNAFSLGKKRGAERRIPALKTSSGSIVSDISGLRDLITSSYPILFSQLMTTFGQPCYIILGLCCPLRTPIMCGPSNVGIACRKVRGSDGLPLELPT